MLSTALLLVVLLLLLLYLGCRKPKGYPPGPKWWPIIGCALEVARVRQETGYLFKTCSALCKKYGPVVGLKIGNDRIVVLNNYESMRMMLADEDCDGRPIGPVFQARTWGSRRGLIVVDGNLWVEQRRFVLRHLREFGFGRNSMAVIIEDEAQKLVEHFQKLLQSGNNNTANCVRNSTKEYHDNDGQIYKLQNEKDDDRRIVENGVEKHLTAGDLYVQANDYAEVRKVSQSSGIIISMHDAFGVSVLNTLWRMMAGKRLSVLGFYSSLYLLPLCRQPSYNAFNPDDKELTYLQRILTKLLREIDMIGAPFGHFPILRFIAPEMSGYNSFVGTHRQLWKFLNEELTNHKNTFKDDSPRDLMDVYLAVLNSKDYGDTFSESQLLAICVDLFIAGSETTSKALGFCFLYLVLFPNVQKKAQEEIDRIIGRDRFPTLADRPRMTYMNAIVLESIRMFMGRTLNVPHRAINDTTILGHRIPKDTMIIANFNGILMDDSWGDPEDFRPERFIDESGNIFTPHKYFPFGMGRHRCMGEILARSNVFLITASLLQTFTFSVVPGEKPSKQDFVDGVTAGPKPFKALLSLRS